MAAGYFCAGLTDGPRFEIVGWIDKADFRNKREVATNLHRLDAGTRFMHRAALWSMDDFSPARMAA